MKIRSVYHRFPSKSRRLNPTARFVITFVFLLTAVCLANEWSVVRIRVVGPYLEVIATISRLLLKVSDVAVGGSGVVLASDSARITIIGMCSGLGVMAVFGAAVMGFPATGRARLFGLIGGCALIFVLNIIRIDVLFLVAHFRPDLFDVAHHYHSQAVIILATVALWLLWASKSSSYASKSAQVLSD